MYILFSVYHLQQQAPKPKRIVCQREVSQFLISTIHTILTSSLGRAQQLLCYAFFAAEFGILKWNFHVLFPVYFNIYYWNKMIFYVKFAIFSILTLNFQNINAVITGF